MIQELSQEARVVVDGDELRVPPCPYVHLPLVLLDHALDDLVGVDQVVRVLALEKTLQQPGMICGPGSILEIRRNKKKKKAG